MKTTRHKPARIYVDLSDAGVARQWSKQLGKSVEEIAAAVSKVGDNAQSVRRELGCSQPLPIAP
jgi:hypothetical protein